ncbi:MAG: hypothetical protein H7839_09455 [Magnetococcus sp. YQC-5]
MPFGQEDKAKILRDGCYGTPDATSRTVSIATRNYSTLHDRATRRHTGKQSILPSHTWSPTPLSKNVHQDRYFVAHWNVSSAPPDTVGPALRLPFGWR